MKDTVERLLAVEAKAEQIVAEARVACDQIVADARNQARAERQRFEKGLPELRQSYLDQVHAPVGLNIGADSPEEISISIVAELVRERRLGKVKYTQRKRSHDARREAAAASA